MNAISICIHGNESTPLHQCKECAQTALEEAHLSDFIWPYFEDVDEPVDRSPSEKAEGEL